MDWSKVDAPLAGALADAGEWADGGTDYRVPVFVHVDLERADPSVLGELGVRRAASGILTGDLSPAGVATLTDQPWVTRVQLSGPLRLLGD